MFEDIPCCLSKLTIDIRLGGPRPTKSGKTLDNVSASRLWPCPPCPAPARGSLSEWVLTHPDSVSPSGIKTAVYFWATAFVDISRCIQCSWFCPELIAPLVLRLLMHEQPSFRLSQFQLLPAYPARVLAPIIAHCSLGLCKTFMPA
jgi:hypothetical protein